VVANLYHYGPGVYTPRTIQIAETPIWPEIFLRDSNNRITEIIFRSIRMASRSPDFEDSAMVTFQMSGYSATARLLDKEGQESLNNPSTLEITSPKLGRMLYTADMQTADGYGRLIEWTKVDGSTVTPESMGHERILNPDRSLRQFRTPTSLLDIQQLDDGNIHYNFYRTRDLPNRKAANGLYEIPPDTVPFRTRIHTYPEERPHILRLIDRRDGKTTTIVDDIARDALHRRIRHARKHDYSPEHFAELDPGGAQALAAEDPLAWVEPGDNAAEVAERFIRVTGQDYFNTLIARAEDTEEFPAGIVYLHQDKNDPARFGKEWLRAEDGTFRRWRVRFYDDQGRLRAEYQALPGTKSPPPTEEADLKAVSDMLEIRYGTDDAEDTSPAELTHRIKGEFVSRTWIREGEDVDDMPAQHIERTENPGAKPGHPDNTHETRTLFWPGMVF